MSAVLKAPEVYDSPIDSELRIILKHALASLDASAALLYDNNRAAVITAAVMSEASRAFLRSYLERENILEKI